MLHAEHAHLVQIVLDDGETDEVDLHITSIELLPRPV
jgi:hypothetical protein